jgi:3-oxoacyl-[acyl-carrier protein] reductase
MTDKSPSLQGRIALITGGSGWIGGGIARHLAASGAKVAINYYRNTAKAQQVVGDIEQNGGIALALQADILDESSVRAMVNQVRARFGAVDILVNNALDSTVPWAAIEDQTWQHYLGHLEFCVKAPLLLLQAVLPDMKAQGFGRVINIGTEAFDLAPARNAQYVASKGAMLGLTRSWANELGSFGITVNSVAPGWIARDGHGFENGEPGTALKEYQLDVPMNRVGTPDDIGAAVAFLSSDQAGFITGQKIAVNGGRTLL